MGAIEQNYSNGTVQQHHSNGTIQQYDSNGDGVPADSTNTKYHTGRRNIALTFPKYTSTYSPRCPPYAALLCLYTKAPRLQQAASTLDTSIAQERDAKNKPTVKKQTHKRMLLPTITAHKRTLLYTAVVPGKK